MGIDPETLLFLNAQESLKYTKSEAIIYTPKNYKVNGDNNK